MNEARAVLSRPTWAFTAVACGGVCFLPFWLGCQSGLTALAWAAIIGNDAVVQCLLAAGASVETVDVVRVLWVGGWVARGWRAGTPPPPPPCLLVARKGTRDLVGTDFSSGCLCVANVCIAAFRTC
jgi:hypothetical protein